MKCCDLYAGKLRHSITFQQMQKTPDGVGGFTRAWVDVATVHAFVNPLSGNERWQSQRVEANTTHRIFIRYRSGITPEMRVNFGGRIMQVVAVLNLEERNKWLEIQAVEGEVT